MKRIVSVLSVALFLAGCSSAPAMKNESVPAGMTSAACHTGDPLAGVDKPARLDVRTACQVVTGVVVEVKKVAGEDAEAHVAVKLDAEFASLTNDKNKSEHAGAMLVEIMERDQKNAPIPKVGDHVQVTGPLVLDKDKGWMEIHPAWEVKTIK